MTYELRRTIPLMDAQHERDIVAFKRQYIEGIWPLALISCVEHGWKEGAVFILEKEHPDRIPGVRSALAYIHDRVDIAQILLAHGADINLRDIKGYTPLAVCLSFHEVKGSLFLLSQGADHRIPTNAGVVHCDTQVDQALVLERLIVSGMVQREIVYWLKRTFL